MTDGYIKFSHSKAGQPICKALGLPVPALLKRANPENSQHIEGDFLLAGSPHLEPMASIQTALKHSGITWYSHEVYDGTQLIGKEHIKHMRFQGLIFDASEIVEGSALTEVYQFFHATVRNLKPSGRVLIIARNPRHTEDVASASVQRGLLGFVKSLAKELGRKGATANILYVDEGAEDYIAGPLRFFASARSAFVSGQSVAVSKPLRPMAEESDELRLRPLTGKVALVTGAAQGIGAEIAKLLSRDGAKVIGLDIPQSFETLKHSMVIARGKPFKLDITEPNAPQKVCEFFKKHGGIDIVVHNAGITRDKTLARMDKNLWEQVLDINLNSIERINQALISNLTLKDNARIVLVSSISGIAGNVGQCNYATSKAAIIGLVDALSEQLKESGVTVNAVAPGFIETEMTAKIPFMTRQLGRRLSSLSQGGLPLDVAETISFYASPQSQGVTGNVLRVCGQSLLGA